MHGCARAKSYRETWTGSATIGLDEPGWPKYPTLGIPVAPPAASQTSPKVVLNAHTKIKDKKNGIYFQNAIETKLHCPEKTTLVVETYLFGRDSRLVLAQRELAPLKPGEPRNGVTTYTTKEKVDSWYVRVLWGTVRVASDASVEAVKTFCENDAKLAAAYADYEAGQKVEQGAHSDPLIPR